MHTATEFKKIFTYKDGELFWNVPRKNVRVGRKAGGVDVKGYARVTVDGTPYLLHRVVYRMFKGRVPKMLDHADGNPLNNRIENLRPCTQSQNAQNRKLQANNTSGIKGVYWNKNKNKWMARVMTKGARKFLGYFDSLDAAAEAVNKARVAAHSNFARTK
jgi:hypothetical protein